MPVNLTQPIEDSVGWAAAVNQNFQDIEAAINSGAAGGVEVGGILLWHSTTPPTGWLLCIGQAVSRTTYADLFAVVGATWGAGDGSTTFNVPDFTGRSPMGVDTGGSGQITTAVSQAKGESTHTMTVSELVAHTHDTNIAAGQQGFGSGYASAYNDATGVSTDSVGSSTPFNIVHPVRGTYFVIRYQATTTAPSASEFADNLFRVRDDGDATKLLALDVSGVTTATTRTLTVPNSNGTIALTSQLPSGSALTKTDDTNVTLILGGTPSTALLQPASVTVGWAGQLAAGRGGTGQGSYTTGDLLYASGAAALSRLGIGSANQLLRTNSGATAPEWASLSTLLDTIGSTRGSLLYRGASGWAAVTPGTSGHVLTSNGTGLDPTYQAAGGGGGSSSFDRLSLTAATTTLSSSDKGKVLWNDYATAATEVDLPTGLGTGTTDAVLLGVVASTPAGGAVQDQVILDPGTNGLIHIPGLHDYTAVSGAHKIRNLDDEAALLLHGRRDPTNTLDLWSPVGIVGRWAMLPTTPFVFGNDVNVNPMHNWGMFQATSNGTLTRNGDMAALTITDPAGGADGQDDAHGYYVATGASSSGVSEATTTPARFGQCPRLYCKFSASGGANYGVGYFGWGTSPTAAPFVGLRLTLDSGATAFTGADIHYRGSSTTTSTSTGWVPTVNAVYQMVIDVHYNGTNPRIQWCIYDASGVRVFFGATEVAATHGPATSATASFLSSGDSGVRFRHFTASRWARRAPG